MRSPRACSLRKCFLLLLILIITGLVGCGDDASTPPVPAVYIDLQSDPGDYIGAGETYSYSQANARISVTATGGHLTVQVDGDQRWVGEFQVPGNLASLQPGHYGNLQRYLQDPVAGALDWYGEGRGSNTLTGWFAIDKVTYVDGILTAIKLRFEQHSEGALPALRGQIYWHANDSTKPPGPVNPPPPELWQAPPDTTPPVGSYVYLESDPGDYTGSQAYLYTLENAQISLTAMEGHLAITISGDENWWGQFQAMDHLAQLQPGYYGNLLRHPVHNPVRGGLEWYGEGRGGNTLTGWFAVDNVTYLDGILTAIDLRFEQYHGEGTLSALRGRIHWHANDSTKPSGPVNPPPPELWQALPDTTPPVGSYVYLESDLGDYIGGGQAYLYTPENAQISLTATGGHLAITISGDEIWSGHFQGMDHLAQLQPGYYGNLRRYPFHNPARGGLDWHGDGRGSSTLAGWFVIDKVTYVDGILRAIDLRFEQHSEGALPALRGQIHLLMELEELGNQGGT